MLWNPPIELSPREERICARLTKQRRFFPFLRRIRHRLFDAAFQGQLATMYSDETRGKDPCPPAFLATVVLLQAYLCCSDFDAVSCTQHDTRWQMVLDCFDREESPFGESTLVDFRARLIRSGMMEQLVRRTVELAKETKGFGYKQVAGLRIALDSLPLDGAGKVEDTINLLGRALKLLMQAIAALVALSPSEVATEANLSILTASSIKAGLDLDWHAPDATQSALRLLLEQMERLAEWTQQRVAKGISTQEIKTAKAQVEHILEQNTDLDEHGGRTLRKGVARDRQISISDPEMRHGRKSKTVRIDGYKQYIATDLDNDLILAAGVLPANVAEAQGANKLQPTIETYGPVRQLAIDTAFLSSDLFKAVRACPDGEVICRPLRPAQRGLFTKQDFTIDLNANTVQCPTGKLVVIQNQHAQFGDEDCAACSQRAQCQPATAKHGRTIQIHPEEAFFQQRRAAQKTPEGRAKLRQRTVVEHKASHQRNRQDRFARYRGVAKNDFDAQRNAATNNLLVIDRKLRQAESDEVDLAA